MPNKIKNFGLMTYLVIGFGVLSCLVSIYRFPFEQANINLLGLAVVTIFFSSHLHIQLPKAEIFLSVSDALVFLSFFLFGAEVAVLLSAAEALYTSFQYKKRGMHIQPITFGLNVSLTAISTFTATFIAGNLFYPVNEIVNRGSINSFTLLVTSLVIIQFLANSILVSLFASVRSNKTFWQLWNESCVSIFVVYIAGAVFACLMLKVIQQIDLLLLLISIAVFAIIYLTYKRYIDDFKKTASQAEQAERERAEQAEKHIVELNHYIAEQERISNALRESKERFRHAAFHDALTKLPNRGLFAETLTFLMEKSKQDPNFGFTVLFLDLNRFKTVNDSLGHTVGDQLINYVAMRLKNAIREEDMLARFGGDEFGIILNGIGKRAEAVDFAERIKEKISVPFSLDGYQVFTSVSIGIAISGPEYENPDQLLRDADIAMYYAKENDEDFAVFDKNMHSKASNLLQLETDLRYAVERKEFMVYYQPIIWLETGSLGGFEALMRWKHPTRGMISPSEFIPLSEGTGLIVPMTSWLLREACETLCRWREMSPANKSLVLSLNLSGKHFKQETLVQEVRQVLEETGLDPRCLKLEITESAVMENAEQTIKILNQLKELGTQISVDDFGTGFSSLSYLHRFPIDTLKIDRSFVSTMSDGSENGEIVRTIISLAKNLGMEIIAEGIETIDQLHQLKILKCEYGQGFLFSRPVPKEEIETLLETRKRWDLTMLSVTQTSKKLTEEVLVIPPFPLANDRLM
jgi:diguanylate cyclase (GGDEF)-like protein